MHTECQDFAVADCKENATYLPGKDLAAVKHTHHWREGNLPSSSKCAVCKKSCFSAECLSGFRCEWCGVTVIYLSQTRSFYFTANVLPTFVSYYNSITISNNFNRIVTFDIVLPSVARILLQKHSLRMYVWEFGINLLTAACRQYSTYRGTNGSDYRSRSAS